jgi:integral membrane protein (TIGR00529 family)
MSPPLAVLATLALVLLVPRRVPPWVAFLAACVLLPVLSGAGLSGAADLWVRSASSRETLAFTLVCAGVFLLSSILTHGGHLAAICDLATGLVRSRRIRAAVMPALVGLVPMPGGAIVSAPLLDRSLGDADVSPVDRNLINYWFRHVWEVSWPLYPSVLLAATYQESGAGIPFAVAQLPLTIVLAVSGWFALLRRVPAGRDVVAPPAASGRGKALVPLGVLIAVPLAGGLTGRLGGQQAAMAAIAGAIAAALATAVDRAGLSRVLSDRRIWSMTLLAFLVKVFGDLVTSTGASASIAAGIREAGVPHWAAVLALPFLIGFASGATLTFVTVAFPILIPADGSALPWLVLGYAGGFVGYLTSPVHMCFVLSSRYFNSKLLSAYGRLAIPLATFLGAAILLFLLLEGRLQPS